MMELFIEAIRPINLPFSVLISLVAIYWLLVALGALGIDFGADSDVGDIDLDGGGHVHLHGGHDHSGPDGHHHGGDGFLASILGFLNVGEVPITIVVSVMSLSAWMLSILTNYYWTHGSLALGMAALLPNLLISAVLTRYVTMPFRPLVRALNRNEEEHLPVVGRTCQITTSEANPRFGQAMIERKGAPLLIDVRTADDKVLPRGSTGLIVRRDEERGVYYVIQISPDTLE